MGKPNKEEWRGQKYHEIPVLNESQMKSKDDEPGEGQCSKTGYGKDDGYDSGGDFIGNPGEMANGSGGIMGAPWVGASLEVSGCWRLG